MGGLLQINAGDVGLLHRLKPFLGPHRLTRHGSQPTGTVRRDAVGVAPTFDSCEDRFHRITLSIHKVGQRQWLLLRKQNAAVESVIRGVLDTATTSAGSFAERNKRTKL